MDITLETSLPVIFPILLNILNMSFTNSVFPSLWKKSMLTPILKKSNQTTLSDYRPISILSILSKVFERIVYNQLFLYLNDSNLLDVTQAWLQHSNNTDQSFRRCQS